MPIAFFFFFWHDTVFHLEERKLLVLLNPKSGPGKARELFQQRVVPVLAEAEVGFDLYVTKHANYARDFVRTRDIYQWRGVVVVGGDGIVFEVINGLFEREDWQKAVKELSIGVIPCGSGNGLAKAISYAVE
jgi:sphingosine kinase